MSRVGFDRPRFLHRAWAALRGHTWIPCPICKRKFGSHEWFAGQELWITERDSVAVCGRCAEQAKQRNADNGYPALEPPARTDAGDAPTSAA